MLFWRANWMPLTISGISGTIARTVTPMKYCGEKKTLPSASLERETGLSRNRPRVSSGARPDLGDAGLVQDGLDVLSDQVGAR